MLNAIITQTINRINDYKAKKYVTEMKKRHEAFQNYGMDLDCNAWAQFNKEKLIRDITKAERIINIPLKGAFVSLEEIQPVEAERIYAESKINAFIKTGEIHPLTFQPLRR